MIAKAAAFLRQLDYSIQSSDCIQYYVICLLNFMPGKEASFAVLNQLLVDFHDAFDALIVEIVGSRVDRRIVLSKAAVENRAFRHFQLVAEVL